MNVWSIPFSISRPSFPYSTYVTKHSLKLVFTIALRFHTIVPTVDRVARTDTVLPVGGGPDGKSPLFVPKGQMVLISLQTMHQRKDLFGEDAGEFKPERWETLERLGWEFVPFLAGPRICIGRKWHIFHVCIAILSEDVCLFLTDLR